MPFYLQKQHKLPSSLVGKVLWSRVPSIALAHLQIRYMSIPVLQNIIYDGMQESFLQGIFNFAYRRKLEEEQRLHV